MEINNDMSKYKYETYETYNINNYKKSQFLYSS